jgi:hypothetical protein
MVHRAHRLLSGLNRIFPFEELRTSDEAAREIGDEVRKRESQRHVSGCKTLRSRLHSRTSIIASQPTDWKKFVLLTGTPGW